jgi:hypothetical protein
LGLGFSWVGEVRTALWSEELWRLILTHNAANTNS